MGGYSVDYQIIDEEWVTLFIPYSDSDLLDALMDIWIERDRRLGAGNSFTLDPRMTELYRLEQHLLSRFL